MSVNNTSEEDTALSANALCQQCGLCCNGVLFSVVKVDKSETKGLQEVGLRVYEKTKDKFVFDQPCSLLRGNSCSGYSSRPDKCRTYHCRLQRKVMNGSVALEDGLEIVSAVKEKVDLLSQKVKFASEKEENSYNFSNFLYSYCKRAESIIKNGKLPPSDKEYISKIFEYTKLVDRHFEKTDLLTKFAALIQNFQAEEPSENS